MNKHIRLLLLSIASVSPLLATDCSTATEGLHSDVRLLMPGTAATPGLQSDSGQDFYQPSRDPQFNTARDQ